MTPPLSESLKRLYRPLRPVPSSEKPRLPYLEGLKAVLFDVYGTLFISGSDDIGISRNESSPAAFCAALEAVGLQLAGPSETAVEELLNQLETSLDEFRKQGFEYPEVDVLDVWRRTLDTLAGRGMLARPPGSTVGLVHRLALEYEARVNPVWPMPGVTGCLRQLRASGLSLGIISNAQFFTRELFPALLGHRAEAWGFDPALQYFSYEHGVAKPAPTLFEKARDTLASRGVEPAAVLYVGNDMLDDIWPATQVGFRTALFAGDDRSLRRRLGDPRVNGLVPDVVLTEWLELRTCFPR